MTYKPKLLAVIEGGTGLASTTANQILYSSGTSTIAGLASANSGVLTTSAAGVPSIDTTNFVVQTTGIQMKGNNANTAPPAGFIGEQIRATVTQASAITLTTATAANVTTISLTTGVWDVSGVICYGNGATGTSFASAISTSSTGLGTAGDNGVGGTASPSALQDMTYTIPSFRITLAGTTTIYLVAYAVVTAGTMKAYGRISGTRVG